MANFQRLLVVLAAVLSMLAVHGARADDPPFDVWYYGTPVGTCGTFVDGSGSTPETAINIATAKVNACTQQVGVIYHLDNCPAPVVGAPGHSVSVTCTSHDNGGAGYSPVASLTCSAGKVVTPESPSACIPASCPPGQQVINGVCAAPSCDPTADPQWQNLFVPRNDAAFAGATGRGFCQNGCKRILTGPAGYTITYGYEFSTVMTGETCTGSVGIPGGNGDPVPPTPAIPANCPKGQAPGTVNGVNTCAPVDPSAPSITVWNSGTSTNSTTSNATGDPTTGGQTGGTSPGTGSSSGGTTIGTGGGGSANSNTNTQNVTSCAGGSCTTVTTTTVSPVIGGVVSSGAGVTSTTTSTGSQGDLCAANPKLQICGPSDDKSITGGGSCDTPITDCEGDAIACAIAKEQLREYCSYNPSNNPLAQKGQRIVDGTETLANDPRLPANIPTVDVSAGGGIDMTDSIGGGGCPADPQITVMGRSFAIPFSSLCGTLAFLGNVAVFAALLLAARIVMGGIA